MTHGAARRAALAWGAAALWTAVILGTFSGDEFSKQATRGIVESILLWLFPGLPAPTLDSLHWWVRKAAHVVEYGMLALLVFAAMRASGRRTAARAVPAAFVWVLLVSGTDETRQSWTAERSGKLRDVLIDVSGAAAALTGARLRWPREGR